MKNKGFTLIELLAALVLLALLSLITVTTASSQYKKGKTKLENNQKQMIKLSAEMYITDNKSEIAKQDIDCFSLDLKFLIDEGYLDEDIKDINTKELLKDSNFYVNVVKDARTYKYNISDNLEDKCEKLVLDKESEV